MNYNDRQRKELYNLLFKTEGVSNIRWSKGGLKDSRYLKFQKDSYRFKVRLYRLYESKDNHVSPILMTTRLDCVIDASNGNYLPEDVINIIDNLIRNFAKYDNERLMGELRNEAIKCKLYPLGYDDCVNMAPIVSHAYIVNYNKKDDKYGTVDIVIRTLAVDALDELSDENLEKEAIIYKRPNRGLSRR